MTIQYKNQGFKQTDTSKTTVLTCPTNGTIIVKSIYCGSSKIQGLISYALIDRSQENG
jgi:hypothetical protein